MEKSNSYRDLVAWQQAMQLVYAVYEVVAKFPSDERYGLVSQLRRSAASIPSNVAEGQGRNSPGEFLQFLGNAKGSLCELETQLMIAEHLGYTRPGEFDEVRERADRVSRLLNGLIQSLKSRAPSAGE